jgi:ABC-type uncharacterized transport system involved in gliding motility auxiliary subunit
MRRSLSVAVSLGIAFVLVLAINLISSVLLREIKLDMTEEKLFTLSDGSKTLMGGLDENIRLKLYYSRTVANEIPLLSGLKGYSNRVIGLLKQYEAAGGGQVRFEILEPRPDTEIEEGAMKIGIRAIPLPQGEGFYFGLAILSEVGGEEVISFLDPNREAYLEYDISRLISAVAYPQRKTVGIMSALNVMGGPSNDPMAQFNQQPPAPAWVFAQELSKQYKVEKVEMTAERIDESIDLLLVIHPKQITPASEYAIDQYLMRGGRLIVMTDPFCFYEQANMQGADMNMQFQSSFDSTLPTLLDAWGIETPAGKVVGDKDLGTPLNFGREVVKHPSFLTLGPEQCNAEEIISGNLENLIMAHAGKMLIKSDAPYEMVPLLQTTAKAVELDAFRLKFASNPRQILADAKPAGKALPLGLRVTGLFTTAFPDGKPAGGEATAGPGDHMAQAEAEGTIIVLSDVDLISDGLSVRKQNFLGNTIVSLINDNINFMNNAVENLLGSSELISLRTRGKSRRPFTRVVELEIAAQEKYQGRADELQQKAEETNLKLRELQRGKQEDSRSILSASQMAEIRTYRAEQARIKKELRVVKRNLRQDKERLGAQLKFINITLMPLLILMAGFIPLAWRSMKMKNG